MLHYVWSTVLVNCYGSPLADNLLLVLHHIVILVLFGCLRGRLFVSQTLVALKKLVKQLIHQALSATAADCGCECVILTGESHEKPVLIYRYSAFSLIRAYLYLFS
jgi:hypothetical protein